jgi:hypothetical protein
MAAQVITTVVTPAGSYDLTTLADVKSELGITVTTNDALISTWITQASLAAALYCNRVFPVEIVKDEFWPDREPWPNMISGLRLLHLTRWPITAVATVIEDGTTLVADTDFRTDKARGQLIRLNSDGYPTRWPAVAISAQYSAGYNPLPGPAVDAAMRMVVGRWYRRGRDPALKSETADGVWSASYWFGGGPESSTGHLTPDVEGLLDAYRVPVIAG